MIESKIAGYPILLPEHRAEFHRQNPDWHTTWLHSIHESLKPDDVVIDVGAEQGDLSALVASWVPDGKVWLVEPVAAFWPSIHYVFTANGLDIGGSFVGFASDVSTRVGKPGWPEEAWGPFVADPGFQHLNERSDLPSTTIDLLCSYVRPLPSALLIDVEGAELKVLHGAEGLLTGYGLVKPPLVWCAIHPEIMQQRYGDTPNELLRFMKGLGYGWEFLDFAGELHFKFSPT